MPQQIQVTLTPRQYADSSQMRQAVADHLHTSDQQIGAIEVVRRSIDSRGHSVHFLTTLNVYQCDEPLLDIDYDGHYHDCRNAPPIVIVGAGPAGIFAALRALQIGMKPIIVERGKPVSERKYDIARLTREHQIDSNSNWCFGEGGAGTYSDGKLYTRSTKRGDVGYVLKRFVEHGADVDILRDTHAHIGTDRLGSIVAAMRETIIQHGGEYHFSSRVVDFEAHRGRVNTVVCSDGTRYEGMAVVLATGHSARDIYHIFHRKGWLLESKPFALGVRVEHSQRYVNATQYHLKTASAYTSEMQYLPAATYSLTAQADRHGVFSFCMCPGGIIVPAATAEGEQVVNGMSNSRRNSPYANSGIAVTVAPEDIKGFERYGVLSLLEFQRSVEQKVSQAAGGDFTAPIQRLDDFCRSKTSTTIGSTSYLGRVTSLPLHDILPKFIVSALQQGFQQFDKKMRGFVSAEAQILAVESRTSSPVRIPRDSSSLQHPQLPGLYPCGEGAGYAGGIVSSALDAIRCVEAIAQHIPTEKQTAGGGT